MFQKSKDLKAHKDADPTPGIATWQYKKVFCGTVAGVTGLNDAGMEGWEVCGIIEEKAGTMAVMKRQCGVVGGDSV